MIFNIKYPPKHGAAISKQKGYAFRGIPSYSIGLKRLFDYYLLCMITARLIRGSS